MPSKTHSFTKTELTAMTVILGALAASALSHMLDLGCQARIATLQGFALAASLDANMGRSAPAPPTSACQQGTGGCAARYTHLQGQQISVSQGARTGWHMRWPTAWDPAQVDQEQSALSELMTVSAGYAYQPQVGDSYQTVYRLKQAPDPTHCSVTYQVASTDARAHISIQTDGC
jgi:hypothetical protein